MAVSIPSGLEHPRLLALLADGRLRSGEWLAAQLGVSRAAVWKGIERLRTQGIEVQALARCGYRLPSPVELLDARRICAAVGEARRPLLHNLELLFEVDSTNTRLLAAPPPPYSRADVCMSELQQAGRGRRGRVWIAPFGDSLALSLGWVFRDAPRALPALSLGVGVAVARGLARAGAQGIELKWPNDIWFKDRKVGGVLIELRAEASGPAHVIIGVGLNVRLPAPTRQRIEASGVRVAAVLDACAQPPSRNFLAGCILDALLSMLVVFEHEGFTSLRQAFTDLDALRDRPAQVLGSEEVMSGIARGVDAQGALLLESQGRLHRFVSGELSLRLSQGQSGDGT